MQLQIPNSYKKKVYEEKTTITIIIIIIITTITIIINFIIIIVYRLPLVPVIFKYSKKISLEYYSYLYFCHFPSTNIFGYSFVEFSTTEYILIFIRKFFNIQIFLNICSDPYFNICLYICNLKSKSRYALCIKKYPV